MYKWKFQQIPLNKQTNELIPDERSRHLSITWQTFGHSLAQRHVADNIAQEYRQQVPLLHSACLHFVIAVNDTEKNKRQKYI